MLISPNPSSIKVLLLGRHGLLGAAWQEVMEADGTFNVTSCGRGTLNLANPASLNDALADFEFDVLINAAAHTAVDDCELNSNLAFQVNAHSPGVLAKLCADRGARMIHFSTDFVFDGEQETPYRETDTPAPLSVYGKSKLEGEAEVLSASAAHTVVRLSWLFGSGRAAFPEWLLGKARESDHVEVVGDKIGCPTHSLEVARDFLPWLKDNQRPGGLWHYCQPDPCAWSDYAQAVLDTAVAAGIELRATKVTPIPISSLVGLIAKRPRQSAMSTAKFTAAAGHAPRPWKESLQEHLSKGHA